MDEVTRALPPEDGEGSRYPVQNTFDVDIHHRLPVFDSKVVEKPYRHGPGIAEPNIKPP